MSPGIDCTCGKHYVWKPQLAGKRGRCQCGRILAFPVESPASVEAPPAEIPLADDPLAAFAGLETTGQPLPDENPPPAPQRRPAAPAAATSSTPSLLARLGVFVLGLAALAWFVFRPIIQVFQNEPSISVSFKGIILAGMLGGLGLSTILLGEKGIPWKKTPEQPVNPFQKAIAIAIGGGALALAGLMWLFFNSHGYTIRW